MIDASKLIGTKTPSVGGIALAKLAWQSYDYYEMRPYPAHAFGPQQWPADKGPLPTPLPYVQTLIEEGAEFVFRGGEPTFTVTSDDATNESLAQIIKQNKLSTEWIPLATRAANIGTLAAKWSYDDADTECPIRIAFLSVPEECRVWMNPHDHTKILMARIQYPYRDNEDGKWYYFREEWTDGQWVTYKPKFAGEASALNAMQLTGYAANLGDDGNWEIDNIETNEFGIIPITLIRNRAVAGSPLGVGDCWNSFKLIDRLALTMHGEDRANQLHSEPIPVITNAILTNTGPLLPGEPVEVRNNDQGGAPADMKLLEPSGAAREYTHMTLDRWQDLLYKQAGLSLVDPATVTNKGNMTKAVFEMLYGRTIATSNRKRTQWGEGGMGTFFRNMLIGLSNSGSVPNLNVTDIDITVDWPDYFDPTDDDIKNLSDRTIDQNAAGILPRDRAAKRVALAEGIPVHEHDALIAELDTEKAQEQPEPDVVAGTVGDGDVVDGSV